MNDTLENTVTVWIDDHAVAVPRGSTVLHAARSLGLSIPTFCFWADHAAHTSCMCCLVRVAGVRDPIPSCATIVADQMRIASETEELHQLRRTGIEMLLSDHAGDCHAPCHNTCPAHMDIPDMLREVAAGHYEAAIATVKEDIALPATLGRVCPEVCEQACRRGAFDSPAAICRLKRFVADQDLESAQPYRPIPSPATGRTVAIVGSGPTGLTAAYHLLREGHECTLIEFESKLGGRLRKQFTADELPRDVLDGEIRTITALAADTLNSCAVGVDVSLAELADKFDAILLATGKMSAADVESLGLVASKSGIEVDTATRRTVQEKVFAAGNAVRNYPLVVQSVAEGKRVAGCIHRFLSGEVIAPPRKPFEIRMGRLSQQELCEACATATPAERVEPAAIDGAFTEDEARREAERCLHCDCRGLENCSLFHFADLYDCNPNRFRGSRRPLEPIWQHRDVIYEPGKCIACGICIQLASDANEPVGLTYVGRGFEMRVAPPPGYSLDEALSTKTALACAVACPTGAIAKTDVT